MIYRQGMGPTIELSRAETTLMRKCILPLISHGKDGPPNVHGTCVVIATFGQQALALTARHVLDEIAREDGSYDEQLHMPDILRGPRKASELRRRHVGSVYQLTDDALCTVRYLRGWISETHDVALCQLELGPDAPKDAAFEVRTAVSFAPPEKGTSVQIGGYSGLARKRNPTASALEMPLDIELQLGQVVDVHSPFRQEQKTAGPVCAVNVESPHGTSGGPLVVHDAGTGAAVVCGVVSSASSFDGPVTYAGMLWPALGMTLNGMFDRDVTLLGIADAGMLDDRSSTGAHASLHDLASGQVEVVWK